MSEPLSPLHQRIEDLERELAALQDAVAKAEVEFPRFNVASAVKIQIECALWQSCRDAADTRKKAEADGTQ